MNNAKSDGIRKGSPMEAVLKRLGGVTPLSSGGYQAHCPCPDHDDTNPSLSVSQGEDGRVLLKCHKGCQTQDIVGALSLEMKDLFPEDHDATWKPWDGTEAGIYTYLDADGQPHFQVVRYEMQDRSHPSFGEKKFLQRAHKPDGPEAGQKGCPDGFVWGRRGTSPVLYHLPRVQAAVDRGETVYFVEGEKDAETLTEKGLTATCIPGGADGEWPPGMGDALAGGRVVCLPDNDEPGKAFMREVATRLVEKAKEVRILCLPSLPPKGDVTDWVQNGGTRQDLAALAEETDPFYPPPETAEELVSLCEQKGEDAIAFEHVDLLAEAPSDKFTSFKRRLKDATGVNLNDLQSAVRTARERLKSAREKKRREERRDRLEASGAPTVVVSERPSSDVVDDLCDAVEEANDPPSLFEREGEIVRVKAGSEGRIQVESVSDALFDDRVCRWTNCVDADYEPRDPSERLIGRVSERVEFPQLGGITQVPILRPDGSVMSEPGYDPETRLLYHLPKNKDEISVPSEPSRENVDEALSTLREAWADHPFADQASRANTLALALSPIVRPLLGDANVPLCIIDATRAGSGKSLLAEIVGTMATRQTPATMSAPTSDAEWRKQITAQLESGERFIVVDDVTGTLDSSSLRRVITSSAWSDRILGATRQVRLPATAIWSATGNNLRPRGDMIRRCFLIRLDTGMVEPWKRDNFTHEQPGWTRQNRNRLAASLLVLARAWIANGKPEPEAPNLGSFERWRTVVGGILQHAGVEGFLENLSELQDSEFSEDHEWSMLLEAIHEWQQLRDEDRFTAKELAEEVEGSSGHTPATPNRINQIRECLPEDIQSRIRRDEPIAKSIGKRFAYREDRRYPGGWHIVSASTDREGTHWQVRRDADEAKDRDFETVDKPRARRPNPTSEDKVGGGPRHNGEENRTQSHEPEEEAPF